MNQIGCISNRILLVDDDAGFIAGLQAAFRARFQIDTAVGGGAGLQKIVNEGPYAVIVADMEMPEMSGLEFLKNARIKAPDTVRMMLTGNSDLQTAIAAVNDGHVFSFLNKPCPPANFISALDVGLEHYRLIIAERQLLEDTLGGAVNVLTEILSVIDPATFDRGNKLKEYVHDFIMHSSADDSWEMELAAMLSQIGRVTIPSPLIEKERNGYSLTGIENDLLSQIPEFGYRLIEKIPRLENVAAIVRYHHRRFDGSGSPSDSLNGIRLPRGSRVLKILSDLAELESRAIPRSAALDTMRARAGWYDLEILAAVSRWSQVASPGVPPGGRNLQSVKIEDLYPGFVLAQDIRTIDGLLILAADTVLTPILIAKVLNFRRLNIIGHALLVDVN